MPSEMTLMPLQSITHIRLKYKCFLFGLGAFWVPFTNRKKRWPLCGCPLWLACAATSGPNPATPFRKLPLISVAVPPGGGGGVLPYVCILGMCRARDTHFQPWLSIPESISFSQITKKSVPEHHHFTFLADFAISRDHHFQNFFNFIASHVLAQPECKTFGSTAGSSRPEHQPDVSWQFQRFAISRSKWLKLMSGAPHFQALAHFSLCRGTCKFTYQNLGWVPPPRQCLFEFLIWGLCWGLNFPSILLMSEAISNWNFIEIWSTCNTLLKSDVTTRDHVVRCRGSQECGSLNVNFACKFHRRSHRVRITLKSTTLLFMQKCTRNVWTMKLLTTELVTKLWTLTAYWVIISKIYFVLFQLQAFFN